VYQVGCVYYVISYVNLHNPARCHGKGQRAKSGEVFEFNEFSFDKEEQILGSGF
jgi:hypothetical protein